MTVKTATRKQGSAMTDRTVSFLEILDDKLLRFRFAINVIAAVGAVVAVLVMWKAATSMTADEVRSFFLPFF